MIKHLPLLIDFKLRKTNNLFFRREKKRPHLKNPLSHYFSRIVKKTMEQFKTNENLNYAESDSTVKNQINCRHQLSF